MKKLKNEKKKKGAAKMAASFNLQL